MRPNRDIRSCKRAIPRSSGDKKTTTRFHLSSPSGNYHHSGTFDRNHATEQVDHSPCQDSRCDDLIAQQADTANAKLIISESHDFAVYMASGTITMCTIGPSENQDRRASQQPVAATFLTQKSHHDPPVSVTIRTLRTLQYGVPNYTRDKPRGTGRFIIPILRLVNICNLAPNSPTAVLCR